MFAIFSTQDFVAHILELCDSSPVTPSKVNLYSRQHSTSEAQLSSLVQGVGSIHSSGVGVRHSNLIVEIRSLLRYSVLE